MANGRVLTGFSQPFIALYSHTGTTITYSSGQVLARGVSVEIDPDADGDENIFYADNVASESVAGEFNGGTVTLTVDGLLPTAEALLFGLPSADGDGWTHYGDGMNIPYVGVGFVCRYMSSGSTTFVPVVLNKCRFSVPSLSANTQEEDIDWQTQELSGKVLKDDSGNGNWKMVGTAQSTEASAVAMIKTALSIS